MEYYPLTENQLGIYYKVNDEEEVRYMNASDIPNIDIPVIYSGGITSIDDIKSLKQINTEYVVIGSALYKGLIEFEDLLEYQD